MTQKIREILVTHYGEPIGGDKTTHWYINDQATQDILKAIELPEKFKPMSQDKEEKVKWYHDGYNQAIEDMKDKLK